MIRDLFSMAMIKSRFLPAFLRQRPSIVLTVGLLFWALSGYATVHTASANSDQLFEIVPRNLENRCSNKLVVDEKWGIDGPSSHYEEDFAALFAAIGATPSSSNYFQEILADRKAHGLSTHVLDLFGSGFFIKNADSITAMRLAPMPVNSSEKTTLTFAPQIYGNAFNNETWNRLDQSVSTRDIPKFDLVVMRPKGGWPSFRAGDEARAIKFIVESVVKRLSKDGEFFFTIESHNRDSFRSEEVSKLDDPEFLREELGRLGFERKCVKVESEWQRQCIVRATPNRSR